MIDGSKGITLQEDEIKQGAPAVKGDQGGDHKLASDHQPQQLATFKKQVDANCIELDSEFVDLNYKVASLIFCHFWRSIRAGSKVGFHCI